MKKDFSDKLRIPLFIGLVACGPARCGESTAPCPPLRYDVRLVTAPQNLGAVVIAIQGAGLKVVRIAAGPKGRLAQLGSPDSYRMLLAGNLTTGRIAEVEVDSDGLATPSAIVLDAAAGAAGGYAPIGPGAVRVVVVRSTQ